MKAIQILSWTTTFPLDAKERKADWSAYEGETKDGCLTLHGLTAEDAEKIVRVLHSYEDVRTNGDKRQTNFAERLMEAQNQPPHPLTTVVVAGDGGSGVTTESVEVVSRTLDLFPENICQTTDFRTVLVHWMRGGIVDRGELLKLAEANRDRLVSLAVVKDVRKKFNSVYQSVQAPTAEVQS